MFYEFDDGDDEDFLFGWSSSSSENDETFSSRTRNENYLQDTVVKYSEEEFRTHFRMSRGLVENISERFQRSTYFYSDHGQFGNISPTHQVLIFIWYAGHQTASFRDVADRFDITISSLFRITRRVAMFLSSLSPEVIKWPSEQEKEVSEQCFARSGFPGVIGAIDGTHITVDRPSIDPDSYINRKGYFSVQMQAVCDHNRKFIDIFVGYPSSVHDSRVFRNSTLFSELEQKCGGYYLLGDSGYPLLKHLLTPYKDRGQLTRVQNNYNVKLAQTRYIIEHTFGIYKQKFRQLYHVKLRNMRFIIHFIRACCVLHNLCLDDNFDINLEELEEDLTPELVEGPEEPFVVANQFRDNVASMLFRL